MDQQETIKFLKNDHKKMEEVITSLTSQQCTKIPIIGNWTVKDILAHISAWKIEQLKDIDIILKGNKPWYVGTSTDEYNQIEIKRRKSWSFKKVYKEWQDSFHAVIKRIRELSSKDWKKETKYFWSSGKRITIITLFSDYTFGKEAHDGLHAKEIKKVFDLTKKDKYKDI
jgi:hypothetical protein